MKKIAIIGTAPLSRDLAPFDDQSWDIWACSPGNMGVLKRVSVWFELHAVVEIEAKENQSWSAPYMQWLRQQSFPVYMQEPNEYVPQAKVFPLKTMIKEFGREWFSSSVAFMQAMAILEKPDEIAIFGVDMAADQEHYTAQRAGCRRFIEIAKERGIKMTIPWESCLGNPPPIYGYSEATPLGRRINVTETMINNRHAEIKALIDKSRMEEAFFAGAMEQLRYIKRTFANGEDAVLDDGTVMLEQLSSAAKAHADKAVPVAPINASGTVAGGDAPNLKPPPWANGNGADHPARNIPITERSNAEFLQGKDF